MGMVIQGVCDFAALWMRQREGRRGRDAARKRGKEKESFVDERLNDGC